MKSLGVVLAVAAGDSPYSPYYFVHRFDQSSNSQWFGQSERYTVGYMPDRPYSIDVMLANLYLGQTFYRRSGALNGLVAQCGSNVPNFTEKCGNLVSPPTCAEDEACYTEDGCAYSCVKKDQCQMKLYNALLDDGKLLCNCELEPTFDYSWTCDFDHDMHGLAFMPPIEKDYPWDDRRFTMLEGTRIDEYRTILSDESSYFNGFFQASPDTCQGMILDDRGTSKVLFRNIFNNQDCMPKCQLKEEDNGSISERCDVVIGYDDLMLSLNGTDSEPAAMARGASWELTCFRTLQDTVEDTGAVIDEPLAPVVSDTKVETIFNLDIACCDPEDPNCTDDCTKTPVIQIGPYAEHRKFFVKADFEYGNKVLKDRGYLHIESCTFEEIDANGNILNGPLELIHDGCPNKFGSMSIIDNMRDRTLEYSNREQMELLPFKIDRGAETFNLTCDLLACPWYAVEYNLCKLKENCDESDRYDLLITYANDNFNPGLNWSGRKRRSSVGKMDIPLSDTIIKTMRHPCTEIKKESDRYCVSDHEDVDKCWTYELCQSRLRQSEVPAVISTDPCNQVQNKNDVYCVPGEDNCWTYELCRIRMSSATVATLSALTLMIVL